MITGHGDDTYMYGGQVRHNFSSNTCRILQPAGLKEHLRGHLDAIDSYPEPEARRLARLLETMGAHGEVVVTNGATEAIHLVARCFPAGTRSAVLVPTFSEYEDACRLCGHEVSHISGLQDAAGGYDIVWICNPNNPTGKTLPCRDIVRMATARPHTTFVVDRSYEYFTREGNGCRGFCLDGNGGAVAMPPNCVTLHSMTKEFAMPGLRLGYVVAAKEMAATIRRFRQPWSVNALAIEAGMYLAEHGHDFDVEAFLDETQRLRHAINAIGSYYDVLPTDTNFMLVRLGEPDAARLKQWLVEEHGILVRDASNFAGLDGHYIRIATQTEEENGLLLEALRLWHR